MRAVEVTISDKWHALGGNPNGGYLLATCLEALRQDVPFPDPLVASAFFLRPAAVGSAEVRARLVHAGRRLATAEAHLLQDGREVVQAVASFTELRPGEGTVEAFAEPPALPSPEDCVDLLGDTRLPGVTIVDRLEYRFAQLPGWRAGRPSGEPAHEFWMRFRDGRDADVWSLPLLVDGAAPAVLELGVPGSSTHQLTVHVRAHPTSGWLACRVSTRHVRAGFHEEDFEIWDSEGKLVAQSRQLGVLPAPG